MPKKQIWGFPRKHRGTRSTKIRLISTSAASPSTSSKAISSSFSPNGEIVDVNLVRDKGTGKSTGFAFLTYEDQRITTLDVDNLNGTQILGRIIRVDHCEKYKKKEEEDEETEMEKREA